MGFNYAIEKAKFEREWAQLRVECGKPCWATATHPQAPWRIA